MSTNTKTYILLFAFKEVHMAHIVWHTHAF